MVVRQLLSRLRSHVCPVYLVLFLLPLPGCGSAVKKRTQIEVPVGFQQVKEATLEELIQIINGNYTRLNNISVKEMEVEFQEGSIEEGYFERYRQARGYLIAKRPDSIYISIQNPLTRSTVISMATTEGTFEIWVPGENKYLLGRTNLKPNDKRPLYNVRPEHLLSALLIEPIPTGDPTILHSLEEDLDSSSKYYIISVLEAPAEGNQAASLKRKLWVERSHLGLVRQRYYDAGRMVSTISYSNLVRVGTTIVTSAVEVERLKERYTIRLQYKQETIAVDRQLKAGIFQIPFPPRAQRVEVK